MDKAEPLGTAPRHPAPHPWPWSWRAAAAKARHGFETTPLLIVVALAAICGDAAGRSGESLLSAALAMVIVAATFMAGIRTTSGRRLLIITLVLLVSDRRADRVRYPRLPAEHVAHLSARVPVTIEGALLNDMPRSAQRVRVRLAAQTQVIGADPGAERQPTHGQIQISLQSSSRLWRAGERVRVKLRLRRPRNFGNPGEFDYEGHLATRGIYATAYLKSDAEMLALGHLDNGWDWLAAWRRHVGELIQQTLPPPQSTVLAALIIGSDTGSDSALPRDLREAFRRAGVSHVLSISGLHVGLVAAAGYAVFRWLLARSRWLLLCSNVPKLAVAVSLLPVLLYAGIAGDNIATRRSVIMIVVFLGAVLVDRQRDLMVSLALAALLILLAAPGSSLDISFQLSFVAVLGLGLAMNRFWPWWRDKEELQLLRLRSDWRARILRPITLYVVVSLSALAATTPLTAYHFNQVSIVAPLANALVVPLLGSVAVVLGLVAALALPISFTVAAIATRLAGPVVQLGIGITTLVASLPFASVRVVTPNRGELTLIYLMLLAVLCLRQRQRHAVLVALALVLSADAIDVYRQRYRHEDLRVSFLSVGQGDCSIVEFPGGEVMLIDGGGSYGDDFDIGERVVAPYLWIRKIARVDYLVLSHPDRDHYGGLSFVTKNFAPREFWTTGAVSSAAGFRTLIQTVRDSAATTRTIRQGTTQNIGGVEVSALAPLEIGHGGDNDDSLVLAVRYGKNQILFPGDIEQSAEAQLLADAPTALSSLVLKVPHHGSRTSSSVPFLEAVQPAFAVISSGYQNRFGFPGPEVIRRYESIASHVLRTDIDGAVLATLGASGAVRVWVRTQE